MAENIGYDINGRKYLAVNEVTAGMIVELDNDLGCSVGFKEIKQDENGLYFDCRAGKHHLDGQIRDKDNDAYYVGVYPA